MANTYRAGDRVQILDSKYQRDFGGRTGCVAEVTPSDDPAAREAAPISRRQCDVLVVLDGTGTRVWMQRERIRLYPASR